MAEESPEKYGLTPEQAFTLGWLYDIGYAFCPLMHESIGGSHLKISGYVFANEVYYHNNPHPPVNYDTPQLRLLHYCDMTTSPEGEDMTIAEHVSDMVTKYGGDSIQTIDAREMQKRLKEFERR